jgi:anti-anti-sigma factor
MQGIRIERTRRRGSPTLKVAGQVDRCTCSFLLEKLQGQAAGPKKIGLDLSDVDFIDSEGVLILSWIRQRLEQQGRTLTILEASPQVRKALSLFGLETFLAPSRLRPMARGA